MLETPNSQDLSESNCYSSYSPAPRYLQSLFADCQACRLVTFKNVPLSEKADECYGEWLIYDEK